MLSRIRKAGQLRLLVAAFAVGILFAQTVVLVHQMDLDAHEAGQACEVCLVASILGGANVAIATVESVPPAPAEFFAEPVLEPGHSQPFRYQARAPPFVS